MSALVTPMELYHAARETCLRLYVANGGDPHAIWTIRPYPGTAAIACHKPSWDPPRFDLAMPAFPMETRLPRWKAELVTAYTVHELLHALWTDFEVVVQSSRAGLHGLVNAIEDNRIEAKAVRGALVQVSEARRLLNALNAHIVARAMKSPGFALNSPAQFSFVLGLVIFAEKHRYESLLPKDWRAHVKPDWLPLFDHALARFDQLQSTADSLALALELKALAATTPKPAKPATTTPKPAKPTPIREAGDDGDTLREAEIVEDENDAAAMSVAAQGEDGDEFADTPRAPGVNGDAPKPASEDDNNNTSEGDDDAGFGLSETPKPRELNDDTTPRHNERDDAPADANEDANAPSETSDDGAQNGPGGYGSKPVEDLSDDTQRYAEANLDDLAQDAAKEAGQHYSAVIRQAVDAGTVLNVPMLREETETKRGGNPKLASAAISSPAKLRRHLTMAVKSPERVANERRQVSGRLDMRNVVGIATGAPNIFRRRVEEEGREAAVSILLDISGSMAGQRLAAAKAMALHMGDALKAAGVKFEICAFTDAQLWTPKPFAKGWATETQRAVAGLRTTGGTAMLPAMKACAERLLKVGNVSRRILLALTDGQDSFSAEANATLCRWSRQRGVEIIGIALQAGHLDVTFAGRAVSVWDCAALSQTGLSSLVKALDQA